MRAIVLTLALVTSPIGSAVCEVVCADHAATGHHAAPVTATVAADHHRHGDGHIAPAVVTASRGTEVPPYVLNRSELSTPDADCVPPLSQPATLRPAVTSVVDTLIGDLAAATVHSLHLERHRTSGPPVWPPPAPPLRSAIPLRI